MVRSCLLLAFLPFVAYAQECVSGVDEPGGELKLCAGTHIAVLMRDGFNSKKLDPPRVETLHDVMVGDLVIIKRGTPVVVTVSGTSAKRLLRRGRVDLQIEAVQTVTAESVNLRSNYSKEGDPACVERDCIFVPLFLWMKGDDVKIPAGTLLDAVTLDTTFLPAHSLRTATAALRAERTDKRVRVFVYTAAAETTGPELRFDGATAGRLWGGGRYACFLLEPGKHSIQVGKTEMELELVAGQEHFLHLREPQWKGDLPLEITPFIQVPATTLLPANLPGTFRKPKNLIRAGCD